MYLKKITCFFVVMCMIVGVSLADGPTSTSGMHDNSCDRCHCKSDLGDAIGNEDVCGKACSDCHGAIVGSRDCPITIQQPGGVLEERPVDEVVEFSVFGISEGSDEISSCVECHSKNRCTKKDENDSDRRCVKCHNIHACTRSNPNINNNGNNKSNDPAIIGKFVGDPKNLFEGTTYARSFSLGETDNYPGNDILPGDQISTIVRPYPEGTPGGTIEFD